MAHRSPHRAKAELESGDADRLRYAALELRFTMEAVTYDRAQVYKAEMPPNEHGTWQPRRVLERLTEIAPHAALTSTISIGLEETPGQPAEKMKVLGTDVPLTMADLKKHYGALGSYLHIPTLDKIADAAAHDPARLRKRCETCVAVLDKVLSSPVWNFTAGCFSEVLCERCGKPVRKRLHPEDKPVEANCFECGAGYIVEPQGGQVAWTPKVEKMPCPTAGCPEMLTFWQDQIKPGSYWACQGCGKSYEIAIGIAAKDAP